MNSVALSYIAALLAAQAGFRTLDGQFVPREVAEKAVQNGEAMLVGDLLIGDFAREVESSH